MRFLAALAFVAPVSLTLAGCGPSYSPDTYSTNAAQQANKVEVGIIAGVRPVHISAQGTTGGVAGAAAGGVAGSQIGIGPTSTFAAIGGSLIGGIAGVATEHIVGDTDGFEYIVRKANNEMVSVAQKDEKPLTVGQKVLVISGPQARIIADYTVPFEASKTAEKPSALPQPTAGDAHPRAGDSPTSHPPAVDSPVVVPPDTGVPPQLPSAFGTTAATPPPIIVPPQTPAGSTAKP